MCSCSSVVRAPPFTRKGPGFKTHSSIRYEWAKGRAAQPDRWTPGRLRYGLPPFHTKGGEEEESWLPGTRKGTRGRPGVRIPPGALLNIKE